MNKILKILSILVIGFVMFSCSTPTSDPTIYISDESGTETPAPTPEEPTYSITFIAENPAQQPVADLLNSLSDYKNLKEGTEVEFPTIVYSTLEEKCTLDPTEITESSYLEVYIHYEGNITSVVVGNEDIEIKVVVDAVEQILKK